MATAAAIWASGGSHSLEKFINGVARDIEDPETKIPVWKRDATRAHIAARRPPEREEARTRSDLRIGALGSGSDYTAFIDHLGIASLNLGFGGEDGGGIYHSIYDDFYWYTHFSDTDFVYGRALAQTAGTAVMRLADAELLPYDFTNFADTIAPLHGRGGEAGARQARRRSASATGRSTKACSPPPRTRVRRRAAAGGDPCRRS